MKTNTKSLYGAISKQKIGKIQFAKLRLVKHNQGDCGLEHECNQTWSLMVCHHKKMQHSIYGTKG